METGNRLRVEDIIGRVNSRLEKFGMENNLKAKIRLSREKSHLLNLLLYILSKDEGFNKGRINLNISFAFPLSSGKFLGAGINLFRGNKIFEYPVAIHDDIVGGSTENTTMRINVILDFYLHKDEYKEERFRIHDLLEDLGFKTYDGSSYPYIEYPLNKEEYLLEE